MTFSWTPRLRTVLLVVNLTVMLLPLGGVTFLRLYENEMIRQKEASLYAQGSYLASIFEREMLARPLPPGYGRELGARFRSPSNPAFPYRPEVPSLQLLEGGFAFRQAAVREPHARRFYRSDDPDPYALAAGSALLSAILRAQTLNLDGVRIVDYRGDVVASSFGEEGRRLAMWEEVQRALQGEYVSLLRRILPGHGARSPLDSLGLGAPLQVYVTMPVVADARVLGAVVLSGTPSQITEFVYGNKGQLVTALAMLMVVVTLISVFSSLTISEPIGAVIRQTELVAQGDAAATRPIRFPVLQEVKLLSEAIARMATVLTERANYITTFARSVSHEFKTPLTGITGATEILIEHFDEMSGEERRRFLGNLNRDAARLGSLVKGLLELARADVAGPGEGRTAVAGVLEGAVARAKAQGLVVDAQLGDGQVAMTAELLESVVGNLLENVRRHCPAGTKATVTAGRAGEWVEITVADDGPGISEGNQDKVFKPFFTTARKAGGTGLGLSIVQSLVRAHHGSVALESGAGGTKLTVRLPAAG